MEVGAANGRLFKKHQNLSPLSENLNLRLFDLHPRSCLWVMDFGDRRYLRAVFPLRCAEVGRMGFFSGLLWLLRLSL